MRYRIGLFALATFGASPALAQAVPAYQTGFQGMGTFSTYPANLCAQCGGSASRLYAIPAEPHDVRVGYRVIDREGGAIGSVVGTDRTSAVVRTPATLVRVPLDAFGKTMGGLVLAVSRTRLEQMARAAAR